MTSFIQPLKEAYESKDSFGVAGAEHLIEIAQSFIEEISPPLHQASLCDHTLFRDRELLSSYLSSIEKSYTLFSSEWNSRVSVSALQLPEKLEDLSLEGLSVLENSPLFHPLSSTLHQLITIRDLASTPPSDRRSIELPFSDLHLGVLAVDLQNKIDTSHLDLVERHSHEIKRLGLLESKLHAILGEFSEARSSGKAMSKQEIETHHQAIRTILSELNESYPILAQYVTIPEGEIPSEPAKLKSFEQKLERGVQMIETFIQTEKPQITNKIHKASQLYLLIIEVLKHIVKEVNDSIKAVIRKSDR